MKIVNVVNKSSKYQADSYAKDMINRHLIRYPTDKSIIDEFILENVGESDLVVDSPRLLKSKLNSLDKRHKVERDKMTEQIGKAMSKAIRFKKKEDQS